MCTVSCGLEIALGLALPSQVVMIRAVSGSVLSGSDNPSLHRSHRFQGLQSCARITAHCSCTVSVFCILPLHTLTTHLLQICTASQVFGLAELSLLSCCCSYHSELICPVCDWQRGHANCSHPQWGGRAGHLSKQPWPSCGGHQQLSWDRHRPHQLIWGGQRPCREWADCG